ncbi:U-box domain-containing protein 14-like [Cucurbita moschata]|uniref:U-box domain-containing protein 14-like n=1 Tax=Cucurbita moschata TaxID=3662 RepID=A0A6J1HGX9_CUCMO|nr:U-box domain-containing protein 14-like [Cucurbita moschata]
MAKCQSNSLGSLVIDGIAGANAGTRHFRFCTAFSGAAFRRRIYDAVSCGGSSRYGHRYNDEMMDDEQSTGNRSASETRDLKEAEQPRNLKLANGRSEKLVDLLNLAESMETENEEETRRKEEELEELKRTVEDLQAEDLVRRKSAASKVRLMAKEDLVIRGTLALLGAIPPLVAMVDLEDEQSQIAALYALLNLGIGNNANKAAIVKVGVIHKMLKLIKSESASNSLVTEAIIANFLGLSALDSNKPVIGSSGAIPFLVKSLQNTDHKISNQARQDALRALFNLSIAASNISIILETDFIPFLLNMLGDMEVSERILSILSNVVSTREGRRAISVVPDAFPILVDVLNWTDSPGCQEKASYVLMVMAHKLYGERQTMVEAGLVSASLELTLLGSALAQKRASRILGCLRYDKGKQVSESFGGNLGVAPVSAPIIGTSSSSNCNSDSKRYPEESEEAMSVEKKAVKQLVQQSLQYNMRKIVKRANLPQDFAPSEHFKSLTASSTSKSLPF